MFRNAFAAGTKPNLELVRGAASFSSRSSFAKAVRWVMKCQTQAAVQEALWASKQSSPYALEQELGLKNANGDLPRLLDRMRRIGQPAIAKYLAASPYGNVRTWQHIQKLISAYPQVLYVVEEPTWRLLNPAPFDNFEYDLLIGRLIRDYWNRQVIHRLAGTSEIKHFRLDRAYTYHLYEIADRLSLLSALSTMRMGERRGDIVEYYLGFLEALGLACALNARSSLGLLKPNLPEFIVRCFGALELAQPQSAADLTERLAFVKSRYLKAERQTKLAAAEKARTQDLALREADAYRISRGILSVDRLPPPLRTDHACRQQTRAQLLQVYANRSTPPSASIRP